MRTQTWVVESRGIFAQEFRLTRLRQRKVVNDSPYNYRVLGNGRQHFLRRAEGVIKMKLLTLNFLTCARKTCKSSPAAFPLHPKEAELEQIEIDMNPLFIKNMLPRLDWEAMKTLAQEVCNSA